MIGYRLVITEDPWPAAPLLLTCRYVCEIGLEALYREIILLKNPWTLLKLMRQPHARCFHYMKILDLRHLIDWQIFIDRLPPLIRRRVLQSQVSALAQYATDPSWNTSLNTVQNLEYDWRDEVSPHLKMIKVSSDSNKIVSSLLPL
jgi:squalene cyclase